MVKLFPVKVPDCIVLGRWLSSLNIGHASLQTSDWVPRNPHKTPGACGGCPVRGQRGGTPRTSWLPRLTISVSPEFDRESLTKVGKWRRTIPNNNRRPPMHAQTGAWAYTHTHMHTQAGAWAPAHTCKTMHIHICTAMDLHMHAQAGAWAPTYTYKTRQYTYAQHTQKRESKKEKKC